MWSLEFQQPQAASRSEAAGVTCGSHCERGHKHARGGTDPVGPHHERVGQQEEEPQDAEVKVELIEARLRQRLSQMDHQPQRLTQRSEEHLPACARTSYLGVLSFVL